MNLKRVITLVPSHSLEDFPQHLSGADAEGLIASWAVAWHPQLLLAARRMPGWYRADFPPEDLEGHLFIVPPVSDPLLQAGWVPRVEYERGALVRHKPATESMLAEALSAAQLEPAPQLDPDLAEDFVALGFAHLMVELLTRQMRYVTSLDEVGLERRALAAAEAAIAGRADQARVELQACFDALLSARERFYPAEAYLFDITLTASSTLGGDLAAELAHSEPANLLIAGADLQTLAQRSPDLLSRLRVRCVESTLSLLGGRMHDERAGLGGLECELAEVRLGLASFTHLVGRRPSVFARRTLGLSPFLPGFLRLFGFEAAIHAAFDGAQTPAVGQSKARWEGTSGAAIEILGRTPNDAAEPGTFLAFPQLMAETMDLDQVATVVFAHWPNRACRWHDALKRITRYAPVLGRWVTADDYFNHSASPGKLVRFSAGDYLADGARPAECPRDPELTRRLDDLAAVVAGPGSGTSSPSPQAATERLAKRLFPSLSLEADSAPAGGLLVVNPFPHERVCHVEVPNLVELPSPGDALLAAQSGGSLTRLAVQVPGCGFRWVDLAAKAEPARRRGLFARAVPSIAEELTLRNEYIELQLDPRTGGILALRDRRVRGNLLSLRPSRRTTAGGAGRADHWRDPESGVVYAEPVADSVHLVANGPAFAESESTGWLVGADGESHARFMLRTRLWAGSRLVRLELSLLDAQPLSLDWRNYYALRLAWAAEEADVQIAAGEAMETVEARRMHTQGRLQIASPAAQVALLLPGEASARRTADRRLDVLLEPGVRYEFGLGVNLPNTVVAHQQFMAGTAESEGDAGWMRCARPEPDVGWFFHFDSKHVAPTAWEPWTEDGTTKGFRLRLVETAGQARRVLLRAFRQPRAARFTNLLGEPLAEIRLEGDAVPLDLAANEWVAIEVEW